MEKIIKRQLRLEEKNRLKTILEQDKLDAQRAIKAARNSIERELVERWIDGIEQQLLELNQKVKFYLVKQ